MLLKNKCQVRILSRKFEFPAHNSKQLSALFFSSHRALWKKTPLHRNLFISLKTFHVVKINDSCYLWTKFWKVSITIQLQYSHFKNKKYYPCQIRLRSESDENGWFTLQNPTSGLFLTGWPGLAYPTVEGEIFIFWSIHWISQIPNKNTKY